MFRRSRGSWREGRRRCVQETGRGWKGISRSQVGLVVKHSWERLTWWTFFWRHFYSGYSGYSLDFEGNDVGRRACEMNACKHPTHHINWHTYIWRTDMRKIVGDRARTGQSPPGAFCLSLLHHATIRAVQSVDFIHPITLNQPDIGCLRHSGIFWWVSRPSAVYLKKVTQVPHSFLSHCRSRDLKSDGLYLIARSVWVFPDFLLTRLDMSHLLSQCLQSWIDVVRLVRNYW